MGQRPVDITEVAEVHAEYEAGVPVSVIAANRDMSRDQIYRRLRAAGTSLTLHGEFSGGRAAPIGTIAVGKDGYVREKVPKSWPWLSEMGGAGRRREWVWQHRKVMAEHLGRALDRTESVHHIDGDRSNNCITNLQLLRHHPKGGRYRCNCCGSEDVMAIEL